jgi:Site-specific recombinase XerD
LGSIETYTVSAGRRYRVRYRDPEHRSREKNGFVRRRDAEDYLANVTVATNRGDYVDPRSAQITVGELGAAWIANQTHLKESTFTTVEIAWRVHIEPAWGSRRVGDIRHSEVQAWVTRFGAGNGKPRSATVVLRAYGVLAGILDVAVRDRRIASNPARGVKLPRKKPKKRVYLTPTQIELLAQQAGSHSTLVNTLAYTGIRWGEAVGLRISAVDLARRRMLIEENAVKIGGRVVVGTPKTHERRSVSFPEFLLEPLAAACAGKSRDQLVFGNGTTHMRTPKSGQGWFWSAVKKCQKIDPDFPTVTPHDLRHAAASMAISARANPKAVQRMLGHASAAMTLDTYADLFEDDLDAVSDRLNALREKSVVGFLWGLEYKEPPD